MPEKISMHCFVRGRVQGVWFRASTQEEAKRLGITGWVRNLPDKSVEVFASGTPMQIKQLHEWLQKGPELAEVSEVTYEELPHQAFERFSVS